MATRTRIGGILMWLRRLALELGFARSLGAHAIFTEPVLEE